MIEKNKPDHALITVFGDDSSKTIEKSLALYLPDRDVKVLTPESYEILGSAAKNSVLVLIGLHEKNDKNFVLARTLRDDSAIVCDIIAFDFTKEGIRPIDVMAEGFDSYVSIHDVNTMQFKRYLTTKICSGANQFEAAIREEEYKRLKDALSLAPVSLIVFDADKQAVFVSDHYYRVYPRIASRLIRGLRHYDAFVMMAEEEGLEEDSEQYKTLQRFWHSLNGSIEYTSIRGATYRLNAMPLPHGRGTVVTGLNLSRKGSIHLT